MASMSPDLVIDVFDKFTGFLVRHLTMPMFFFTGDIFLAKNNEHLKRFKVFLLSYVLLFWRQRSNSDHFFFLTEQVHGAPTLLLHSRQRPHAIPAALAGRCTDVVRPPPHAWSAFWFPRLLLLCYFLQICWPIAQLYVRRGCCRTHFRGALTLSCFDNTWEFFRKA